jgi:hypothetical protein
VSSTDDFEKAGFTREQALVLGQGFDKVDHEIAEFRTEVNRKFDAVDHRLRDMDNKLDKLDTRLFQLLLSMPTVIIALGALFALLE